MVTFGETNLRLAITHLRAQIDQEAPFSERARELRELVDRAEAMLGNRHPARARS